MEQGIARQGRTEAQGGWGRSRAGLSRAWHSEAVQTRVEQGIAGHWRGGRTGNSKPGQNVALQARTKQEVAGQGGNRA